MRLPSSSSTQRSLEGLPSTKFRVGVILVASFEALFWVVAENSRCSYIGQVVTDCFRLPSSVS